MNEIVMFIHEFDNLCCRSQIGYAYLIIDSKFHFYLNHLILIMKLEVRLKFDGLCYLIQNRK